MNIFKKYKTILIFGIIIIIIVFSVILKISIENNSEEITNKITTSRTILNLEPDAGFLECIAVQHKCIYDHINKGQEKFILRNCQDENYCNSISR